MPVFRIMSHQGKTMHHECWSSQYFELATITYECCIVSFFRRKFSNVMSRISISDGSTPLMRDAWPYGTRADFFELCACLELDAV